MNKMQRVDLTKYKHIIISQFLIFSFCIFTDCLCNINYFTGLRYFFAQLISIFIPGIAITAFLFKNKINIFERISYSYVFGLLIVILEYLLVSILNIYKFSPYVSLFLLIVSVFYLMNNNSTSLDDNNFYIYFFIVLLFIICFFAISFPYHNPTINGGTYYNKDFLFWIGNSISFTKGLPVQNFRLVGVNFYYHFFSNIVIAQTSLISNIDILTLSYYYSYIIPCFLLVFSSYVLLETYIKNNYLLIVGIIGILLCEGSTVFLPDHLYYCPFGFDYAYALAMLSISFLIKCINNNELSLRNILLSCVFIMLTTGFKGPISLVVLMFYGIITFSMLIRKEFNKGLLCGFLWLLSFIVIYLFVITGFNNEQNNTNGLLFLGLGGSFDRNIWAIEIFSDLIKKYSFPDNAITRLIAIFLYVLRSNRLAITLLLFSSVYSFIEIIKHKKINDINIGLILLSVWGVLLTLLTHQDGNSQMYFMLSVYPFSILLGLSIIYRICNSRRDITLVFLVLMLFVSFDDIYRFYSNRLNNNISNSISIRQGDTSSFIDKRYYFKKEDYEVCLWLKNNTLNNDYIALDCYEYDGIRKEEGMGVLSERFFWNDGQYADEEETNRRRKIVENVMNNDLSAIDMLRNEKVKYLIQNLSLYPDTRLDLRIVYSSDNYIIYKVD